MCTSVVTRVYNVCVHMYMPVCVYACIRVRAFMSICFYLLLLLLYYHMIIFVLLSLN